MDSKEYDVLIIGGGIIGLSTAMQLVRKHPRGLRVAVVEKEVQLATHQTGHNSGVIHSGIYYRPGSQKAAFCVDGAHRLRQFYEENEIEYQQCGKTIVASDESELDRLETLYQRGVDNGVQGLELVGPERLKEIEPYVHGIRALWAPQTGIIDYVKVASAYGFRFQQEGGDIYTGAAVHHISGNGGSLAVSTLKGVLQAKHIINCAGLYADRVAEMTGELTNVRIIPFRGEYYTLRPESRYMVKGLIYPVPDPAFPFLGVHFTRNIHGQVGGSRAQRGAGPVPGRVPEKRCQPGRILGNRHFSWLLEDVGPVLEDRPRRSTPFLYQKSVCSGPPKAHPGHSI